MNTLTLYMLRSPIQIFCLKPDLLISSVYLISFDDQVSRPATVQPFARKCFAERLAAQWQVGDFMKNIS